MICYNIDSETVISIDVRSAIPIPVQILSGFRELIQREHLKPGDQLPSIRALAKKLVVSPDIVQTAYHEALSQGLFEKTKSGYCVSSSANRMVHRVPEPLLNLARSIQIAREEGFNWESIQNVVDQLKNPKLNLQGAAICPYCRQSMEPTDSVVSCFACNTAHHEECWNEVSRCSIFGCGSSVRTSADN
jgi:GntR family transcriptional regulator